MLSLREVSRHNSQGSCWIVVAGQVYDVTEYLAKHPGGASVILRYAGRDATAEFEAIHPEGTIAKSLAREHHLGPLQIDPSSTQDGGASLAKTSPALPSTLPLSICRTLSDLESVALQRLSPAARVYYTSATETHAAKRANAADWGCIRFRPRVLRNVARCSMKCDIMGQPSTLPVFVAPAARAKMGHVEGELCLTRGAVHMGIPQCVSSYASLAHEDIAACFRDDPMRRGGAWFFQLYVPQDKVGAEALIEKARRCGYQALVVTVDSPVIGKRDDDDRFRAAEDWAAGVGEKGEEVVPLPGEEPHVVRSIHCPRLEWSDLPWIRKLWGDKPIILKGIQSAEDAALALEYDVQGIYLSNHGGRQLDYAPTAVETLIEIRQRHPDVFDKLDVYVDGGVKRGSDVVKAICLGAKAVGIGRGFMFALSAYGTDGVIKAIQILSDEIQTTMRLLGVTQLSDLNEDYIHIRHVGEDLMKSRL